MTSRMILNGELAHPPALFHLWNQKQPLYKPSRPWALGPHPTFQATPPFPVLERLGDLGPKVAKLVQVRPAVRQVHLEPDGLHPRSEQVWGLLPASDKSPSKQGQSVRFRVCPGQLIYYSKSPAKEQVPFQEHVCKSYLFARPTKLASQLVQLAVHEIGLIVFV